MFSSLILTGQISLQTKCQLSQNSAVFLRKRSSRKAVNVTGYQYQEV